MSLRRTAATAALALAGLSLTAAAAPAATYFDVAKLPLPPIEGKEIADSVATFVTDFQPRVTGTPQEQEAGEWLRAEAEKLGYKAENVALPAADGDPGSNVLRAIVATKQGTTHPDEYIAFMSHYDTVAGFGGATLEGAYDNGSGTMFIQKLAKAFATVPTNRSLMFIWYNGEEEGVLASAAHAAQVKAAGLKIRAGLGYDMVGIAYPVAAPGATNCLCMWHGEEDDADEALLRHINFNVLRFPDAEELVSVVGQNARNSDESSWDGEGYRTLRWAGMRTAAAYPAYHMPDDTMDTIDTVAGGRTFFEQGLRNTLLSSYLTTLAIDNEMPVAKAAGIGSGGSVTFDAAGSGDPDGPPAAYTWDFGDGTTASGQRVVHTYAKEGDYVAKLTVTDNLHPQVNATAVVPLHANVPAAPVAKKPAKALKRKLTKKQKRYLKRCVAKTKKIKSKKKRAKAKKRCEAKARRSPR